MGNRVDANCKVHESMFYREPVLGLTSYLRQGNVLKGYWLAVSSSGVWVIQGIDFND